MKKLSILLIVFILAAGFAFAQEETQQAEQPAQPEPPKTEFFNLEITIGFPVHWTTGMHNDSYPGVATPYGQEDRFASANTAIGFAMNMNFNRVFGIALDFDFFYAAKLNGISTETSDYISMSGFNLFFGPVFYLFNNNILRIPLAIGFHMYYFNDDLWVPVIGPSQGQWVNRDEFQLGAGLYLGVQFHFNKDLYIFSRTNVAIDFFRMHTMKGADGTDYYEENCTDAFYIHWNVKPTIGVGIKF